MASRLEPCVKFFKEDGTVVEIGSVNQTFQVFQTQFHREKTSSSRVNLEQNFAEVFAKIAQKNVALAVIQKSNVSAGEINGYASISLKPKNKKWEELEEEALKEMLQKIKRIKIKWSQDKKGRQ